MAESDSETLDLSATAALVLSVFRAVWTEFYAWEQEHCRHTIQELAPKHATVDSTTDASITFDDLSSAIDHVSIQETAETSESFTTWDYSDGISSSTLTVQTVVVPSLSTYPEYESCTPIMRNIMVGDDSDYMPFISLADDPTFDIVAQCEEYRYFDWQTPNRDPDVVIILLETARRLHIDHQVPSLRIDETNVLPRRLYPSPGDIGLLQLSRRSDFPKQSEDVNLPSSVPRPPDHTSIAPGTDFTNLLRYFCNNTNCVVGYCWVHLGDFPLPESITPLVASSAMWNSVEGACSKACFILGRVSTFSTLWTAVDISALQTVLIYSPDLSPCDLAVICHKPCNEVFKQRMRHMPDSKIAKPGKQRPAPKTKPTLPVHDSNKFTPNRPCSHKGPCTSRTNCPCYLNQACCEQSCGCDSKCRRRWPGCTCAKTKSQTTCGTSRCPCFEAHRECVPEICKKCNAKDATANLCKNAALQQNRQKRTEVRQSQWGLGLFLAEPAEAEDLIVEYIGELIYEPTCRSRDIVARHRGRTYLFQLNSTLSIDSTTVGNESRYINHHSTNNNCHASVRLVNGEHRIGIFASYRIEAGSEILFNYGHSFFPDDVEHSESDGNDISRVTSYTDGSEPTPYVPEEDESDDSP